MSNGNDLLDGTRRLLWGVLGLDIVKIVLIIGLSIQISNRDPDIDETHKQVKELKSYVDALKKVTPEERRRNEAVTRAVQIVPEIKVILCGQFPDAQGCQP